MRRPPRSIIPFLVGTLGLTVALVGCGGSSSSDPIAEGHVDVVDNAFKPGTINISVGDTVTWDFKGGAVHNVVGFGADSGSLKKGDTFTHTFNSAGSFGYVCTIHTGMTGTVKVE